MKLSAFFIFISYFITKGENNRMNATMIIVLVVGIAIVVPFGIFISWMDSKRYKNTTIQKDGEKDVKEEKNEKNNKKKKK